MKEKMMELNLLLLYLSGWEEDSRNDDPGNKIYRAWKGFLFEVLNELEDKGFITQFRNGKSVIVTPEGVERAKKLQKQYLGSEKHEQSKW